MRESIRYGDIVWNASKGVPASNIKPALNDAEMKMYNEIAEMSRKAKAEGRKIVFDMPFDFDEE